MLGTNVIGGSQESSDSANPSPALDFSTSSAAGLPTLSRAPSATNAALLEANSNSLGFSGISSLASLSAPVVATSLEPPGAGEASGSESDREGGESGSESDDESSDGEEDSDSSSSSGDEGEDQPHPHPPSHHLLEKPTAKSSVGSSVSSAPFFSSDDNFSFQGGGFFNDEDFLSRLQANNESTEMEVDGVGGLTHERRNSLAYADELQPALLDGQPSLDVGMSGVAGEQLPPQVTVPPTQQEKPVNPVSSDAAAALTSGITQPQIDGAAATGGASATAMVTPSRITTQLSLDSVSQTAGKKRKLERQSSAGADLAPLPPPARKTPRTGGTAPRVRRHSSLSSFSVSSDSSSGSSDSSGDEDSDAEEDSKSHPSTVHPSSTPPSSLSHTSTGPSTSGVFAQSSQQHTATVQLINNRRGSIVAPLQQGGLEAGELEEDEVEGDWMEIESLWVKISLQKVDFQKEQKPKVSVWTFRLTVCAISTFSRLLSG